MHDARSIGISKFNAFGGGENLSHGFIINAEWNLERVLPDKSRR